MVASCCTIILYLLTLSSRLPLPRLNLLTSLHIKKSKSAVWQINNSWSNIEPCATPLITQPIYVFLQLIYTDLAATYPLTLTSITTYKKYIYKKSKSSKVINKQRWTQYRTLIYATQYVTPLNFSSFALPSSFLQQHHNLTQLSPSPPLFGALTFFFSLSAVGETSIKRVPKP